MNYKEITTHEEACKVLNKDASKSTTTDQQLVDIAKAINSLSGFKPDFTNRQQKKWRPFFYAAASGFRFALSYFDSDHSTTDVGSRLCHYFATEEEANHYGVEFLEIHKQHYYGE